MTWKNFPIPETIVFPLGVGLFFNYFFDQRLLAANSIWTVLAGIFILIGFVLMIWSVREVGRIDMTASDSLITSGPYSFSRNPMYVSWISIYLGVFLFNRSIWLLLLFFVALLSTHFLVVINEENLLRQEFGKNFVEYCQKVRRYF